MASGPSRSDLSDVRPPQQTATSSGYQQRPMTSQSTPYPPYNIAVGSDEPRTPWPGPDLKSPLDIGLDQRRQSHTLPPLQQAFPTARLGMGQLASNIALPSLDPRGGLPPASHGNHPLHSYNDLTPATKRRRVDEGFRAINHADQQGRSWDYNQPAASPRQVENRLRETLFSPQQDSTRRPSGCCAPGCALPNCSSVRSLLEELIDQIIQIDMSEPHLSVEDIRNRVSPIPHLHRISIAEALDWTIRRLKKNNAALQSVLATKVVGSTTRSTPSVGSSAAFAQINAVAGSLSRDQNTGQPDSRRQSSERPQRPSSLSVDVGSSIAQTYGSERAAVTSPPGQVSTAIRLPTPTSMNAPISSSSGSPAFSTFASASATNVLTQELQHQVSVKALALQTLQREYDGLLAKLDRQRLKSAALEKKFEVSDVEIISLTDDKERLEKQVEQLERQFEEASRGRDEARKSYADQASQYMQIMDMGSKTWEKERTQLLQRVTMLETTQKSVVSRVSKNALRIDQYHGVAEGEVESESAEADAGDAAAAPAKSPLRQLPAAEPIKLSPAERSPMRPSPADLPKDATEQVKILQDRVSKLEQALQTVKQERTSVRDAAIRVVASGDRIDTLLRGVFDESP